MAKAMRKLLGRLVCRWKGKHVERRVTAIDPFAITGDLSPVEPAFNRVCTRCGARRLAPQRKKAAK